MSRTLRTDRARETFLKVLAETCNVSEAARNAGIGRRTAYEWRDADPDFAAKWEEAEESAADKLEREAWRRAVEGTDKPISYQGTVTATYKEYSDRMLEILLKAHRPGKFVERIRNEHTGKDGGPIQHEQVQSDADAFESSIAGLVARGGTATVAGDTQH